MTAAVDIPKFSPDSISVKTGDVIYDTEDDVKYVVINDYVTYAGASYANAMIKCQRIDGSTKLFSRWLVEQLGRFEIISE